MDLLKTVDREFYKKLGRQIREERTKRDFSLRYLSERTGIARVILDYYELGFGRIKYDRWKLIANALKIPEKINVQVKIGNQFNK